MQHKRSAGAQVDSTWHDLCLCSRYIVRVFRDMLSATAQQTTTWRRPNRGSRWLCGQQGLSVHLNPNGCLPSPRCHCAHTLLKHTDLPPATFHVCCFHHSPNIQHSLLCCPHPPLPGRRSSPCSPRYRLAGSHSTGGGKKLKESPFKSSSCPASRKVSLPTPQIRDTDVKLMPHLISAKKPRGFKTFIHLKL